MEAQRINFEQGIYCDLYRKVFIALLDCPRTKQIAEELSLPRNDVRRVARETEIFVNYKSIHGIPKDRYKKIIDLLAHGRTPRAICQTVGGITQKTIRRAIQAVEIDIILPALRKDPNVAFVARQTGLPYGRVLVVAKEAKIPIRLGAPALPEKKRQQIVDLLNETPNIKAAARQVSVSPESVRRIAHDINIAILNSNIVIWNRLVEKLRQIERSPAEMEMAQLLYMTPAKIRETLEEAAKKLGKRQPRTQQASRPEYAYAPAALKDSVHL